MSPGTGEPALKTNPFTSLPALNPSKTPVRPPFAFFLSPHLPRCLFYTPCTVNMRKTKAKEKTKQQQNESPPSRLPTWVKKKSHLFFTINRILAFFFHL
jgi:hypothetical protein